MYDNHGGAAVAYANAEFSSAEGSRAVEPRLFRDSETK